MVVDSNTFDCRSIIYTIKQLKDEGYNFSYHIDGSNYILDIEKNLEEKFSEVLNDYVLRVKIAEEVKPIKQIIIQRALFDLIEED